MARGCSAERKAASRERIAVSRKLSVGANCGLPLPSQGIENWTFDNRAPLPG